MEEGGNESLHCWRPYERWGMLKVMQNEEEGRTGFSTVVFGRLL